MSNQTSEKHAAELEALRKVIPHAAQVGADKTTISIELLSVLLATYDKERR